MFTFLIGLGVGLVAGWFLPEIIYKPTYDPDDDKFNKDNPVFIYKDGKMYTRVGNETSNIYRDEDGNEYERGKDGFLRPRHNLNYR